MPNPPKFENGSQLSMFKSFVHYTRGELEIQNLKPNYSIDLKYAIENANKLLKELEQTISAEMEK